MVYTPARNDPWMIMLWEVCVWVSGGMFCGQCDLIMRSTLWLVLCACLAASSATVNARRCSAQGELGRLEVSTDFEGGSARIIDVDSSASTIHFSPGGNAENGWVCWWAMKVSN